MLDCRDMVSNPPAGPQSSAADSDRRLIDARKACDALRSASTEHAQFAQLLDATGRRGEAVAVLRDAVAMPTGAPADYEAIAFVAFGLNEHDLARDAYAKVVALAPNDGLARYNLATAERNLGNLDQAYRHCDEALARDPSLYQAALLRSQLKTQSAETNTVDWLRATLSRTAHQPAAAIFLNYALGKELEDLGDYRAAFAHFRKGARARRETYHYDVAQDRRIMARIESEFTASASPPHRDPTSPCPFGFVLGLPRSGTTLVERVLTGHAGVESNGETDNFSNALFRNLPATPEDIFARAANADCAKVGSDYASVAARPFARTTLEKLPLNFLYIGAISRALPDAAILVVRRHPVDTCLAMFTTLFGTAYPFSYDLDEVADYYAGYDRLMQHWKRVLGARILEVPYEGFVREPRQWGPILAAHLGTRWDETALQVERNPAPTTSASAVQVRRPIYTSAAGRWTRYRAELEPLIERLRRTIPDFDPDTNG